MIRWRVVVDCLLTFIYFFPNEVIQQIGTIDKDGVYNVDPHFLQL